VNQGARDENENIWRRRVTSALEGIQRALATGTFTPAPPSEIAADAEGALVVVERIMTQHWDLSACRCWVCTEARAAGCRPRDCYSTRFPDEKRPSVHVDEPGSVRWFPTFESTPVSVAK
jgi:hypothetical protein